MADPNNWTDGRSTQTSAGGPAGYQQLGQPSGQFGTLGPPKANTMPTSVSSPGQMTAQQFSVPQANQSPPYAGPGGGAGQRPPGPQPGVQFRPPGHVAAGSWQPSSATPPPGQPAGLMQTGIPRSSSSPSVPGPNQGPGGAPAMVNGLPHGPHRPPTPLNGQLQAPPGVNQSGQQYAGVPPPPASRQNQGSAPMPAVSKQVQSTTSNPLQPTGAYQPQPNVSSATMARSTPPVGGPAIRAPPPSQGPQTGQMFNSRPNELPLPYHGHGQYSHQVSGLASSATPGLTPNNSEPPSQRSSRAPSPVSGQKYDALEGQFSPQGVSGSVQDGKQSISQPMQFTQPTRPAVPGFGHQQAPRPQWMMNQPSEPTRYTSQPGQGMSGQQPSHPPAVSGRPPPPSGMAGQPPPPLGHAGQPPPQLGMAGQPPPPTGLTGQPPPPPGVAGQHPPSWGVTGQPPLQPGVLGQPPPPVGGLRQPAPPVSGQPPPPPGASGEAPLPPTVSAQYTTPPATSGQMPSAGSTGITGPRHYPQMAPTSMPGPDALSKPAVPTYSVNSTSGGSAQPGTVYPANSTHSHTGNPARLSSSFSNMRLQPDNQRPVNLLQERDIIPPEGVELPRPDLPAEYRKANCSPDIFRCTLNSIPNTESLLNKSRLPLGILIHPFKDLAQLPVIQSSVIVRCRSCRTYINPFVTFVDSRRWKCNLCYRNNELPEEFNYDPVSRTYGEPQRRPEVKSGTIEFIAPSEYMLRPPQPAAYLFVLDVSFNAKGTGYLQAFCQTLLDELDRLPGDARTQIGFIAFDRSLYYFNIGEGLSQPQLLVVSDIEEVFLPSPDNLLVNLNECKDLVIELLNILPDMFKDNLETGSALGPAIEAAFKLLSPTGGRISVFQTQLPTVGNGALKSREDPNERSGKKIQHLGPATDFYKQLALNCSAQQVAVDLFMFNSQYADIASIACVSKYSGGSLYYFPGYHNVTNPTESDRFEGLLKRYLTRKIGFEAVMRIRCSRGLSIHTFHGNFFVRSTDLLSLPNVNPDAGFGMQMSIEDTIEANYVCFQAALLYTSSKGERRIRVHTLAVPVAKTLSEVHAHADQQAIIGLLAKMGVDRSLTASMSDARDAMINAVKDMLTSYGNTLTSSQRVGQLPCAYSLRLQPLYTLALLKSMAFRVGSSTKLDDRVYAMEQCKNLPLCYLMLMLYPNMYPLHSVDENHVISKGDLVIPQLPVLQLSSAHMDRHGVYLLDAGSHMIIWVGAAISDQFCQDVFDRPQFSSLPDAMLELPDQDNETSDLIRTFITHLNDQRPYPATLLILREDSRSRYLFLQYMIEDHTESTMSYYEFLQHLQKEIKS